MIKINKRHTQTNNSQHRQAQKNKDEQHRLHQRPDVNLGAPED